MEKAYAKILAVEEMENVILVTIRSILDKRGMSDETLEEVRQQAIDSIGKWHDYDFERVNNSNLSVVQEYGPVDSLEQELLDKLESTGKI